MQEKFSDDVASLGDFIAYLGRNGVVEPRIKCHECKTEFTKNAKDKVIGCTVSITRVEPCAFKVMKRPANIKADFDTLGSTLVLGDVKSWDLTTCKHCLGYLIIIDRMVYNKNPLGEVAPLQKGVCLDKTIRIKKGTLRQLA